ncbi:MAG: formate dehydrogenase accessory sulfurtransferase FdhD [Candidatus Bipolaricaulia bacterium]
MAKSKDREIIRWEQGEVRRINDRVVVESPLEIVVNGRTVVTLLCSPENQKALALGYLRSEGLVEGRKKVKQMDCMFDGKLIELRMEKDGLELEAYFDRKRALTSGCGKASTIIDEMGGLEYQETEGVFISDLTDLTELMKALQKKADLFRETGGSHTAALARPAEIEYLAEDIGRHNAVDKVIGQAVLDGRNLEEFILLTSGRLSSEMVLKAIRSSISIVVSRSAPTTLAVSLAEETGLTMVGFTRGNRFSVYSGERRIKRISSGQERTTS